MRQTTRSVVCILCLAFTALNICPEEKHHSETENRPYGVMLQQLQHAMLNYQEKWLDTLGGKPRNVFVP